MTTVLTLRQGTTAEHAAFTGDQGELSYDTEKKTVLVHDGSTVGGIPLAKKSEVDVKADDANVVKVVSQTLDETKKSQARTNIGAAKDAEVIKNVSQTLTDTQADQACENLKINQALRELITAYGGTVPTSLSEQSVQTLSVEPADPWSQYED